MLTRTVSSLLLAALLLACAAPCFAEEAKLIAVLKSDAPRAEKATACRLLARVGTKAAVPALAALLGEADMHHMARYALEPIPDPSVDDALRAALGKLKGLQLIGVIGSIGVRRDAKAVDDVAKFLADPDTIVVRTAARALGRIGTPAAADALSAALPKASKDTVRAVCEGLFRCAEALATQGQTEKALAVYEQLRGLKNAPHQVRAGALRGVVLTRGKEAIPLLVEALRGDEYVLAAAAARTAMELPAPEVTKALADELGKLPADKQILVTLTLGIRRDAAALPALLALAKAGEKPARIAAVRAAVEIGGAATVPVFVALMADPEAEIAAIAQSSLAALSGPEVDAAIAGMLTQQDPKARIAAIELLDQRRSTSSVPALLKATADADEAVRIASIKVLGGMADLDQYPALVNLLVKAKSPAEARAAERALGATATRLSKPIPGKVVIHKALYGDLPDGKKADITRKVAALVRKGTMAIEASNSNFGDPAQGTPKKMTIEYTANGIRSAKTVGENDSITLQGSVTPPACVDALCAAMPKAPSDGKLALLRLLRSAGGPEALAAVLGATKDADAEVAGTAVSLLCQWPSADALPHVIQLAKTSKDAKNRILGLRGYIRLIPQQEGTDQARVASMKDAMGLATRNEEKKLALSTLGTLPTVEALALVAPCLEDNALKEEASIAAVAIAEKIVGKHPAEVAAAMEKVTQETANKTLAGHARTLLNQARKAAPRK